MPRATKRDNLPRQKLSRELFRGFAKSVRPTHALPELRCRALEARRGAAAEVEVADGGEEVQRVQRVFDNVQQFIWEVE